MDARACNWMKVLATVLAFSACSSETPSSANGTAGGQSAGGSSTSAAAGQGTGNNSTNTAGAGGQGGASATGGQTNVTAATPAEFCRVLLQANCDHVTRCGCGVTATLTCYNNVTTTCNGTFWSKVNLATQAGDLIFHPEAVPLALAPLSAPSVSCSDLYIDLGWDGLIVQTYGNVFSGMRPLGSDCTMPSGPKGGIHDCQPGLFCWPNTSTTGLCVNLAGAGEACTIDRSGAICFERHSVDVDNEFASSFESLECIADAPGSNTGTCQRALNNGQPCHNNDVCTSGRCMATGVGTAVCAAKANDAKTCVSSLDCESGACNSAINPGICGAPLADGAACGFDDLSCASGSCHSNDNQSSSLSAGNCGPKLELALGAVCTQSYECKDAVCRMSHCTERTCRHYL